MCLDGYLTDTSPQAQAQAGMPHTYAKRRPRQSAPAAAKRLCDCWRCMLISLLHSLARLESAY